jgi:molybdate transport system substrate-binding protein
VIAQVLLRRFASLFAAALFIGSQLAAQASAAEVRVMISGAFTAPFEVLKPEFEKQTGNMLITISGPSMGETPQAIPNRLARGEADDIVIVARSSADMLAKNGMVDPKSVVDLVHSQVGFAVKAGAPVPDISTPDKLKAVLLKAKSIGYSDSASGVYVGTQLFKKLGIESEVSPKARKIPATPVGELIASGEIEVGFQQVSELKPVKGITLVGPIPSSVQLITPFTAAISAKSQNVAAAKQLIAFLTSPKAYDTIKAAGLEPAAIAKD